MSFTSRFEIEKHHGNPVVDVYFIVLKPRPKLRKIVWKIPVFHSLPADVFRSRFIWKIYETIKIYPWVASQFVL